MSAAQLRMLQPDPPPLAAETYWAWQGNRKAAVLASLEEAREFRRLMYFDEVLAVTLCSVLAAQLPADLDLPVIANDRVPPWSLYFTVEEATP